MEEMLFGEAGFEIQNILLQPRDASLSLSMDSISEHILKPLPIAQVLNEEEGVVHPKMVSSLRSSNPITLNSPFHLEDRGNYGNEKHQIHIPARLYQPSSRSSRNHHHLVGNGTNINHSTIPSHKNSRVGRSASWPSLPNASSMKKAEKSS